jgi:hypothetical protein
VPPPKCLEPIQVDRLVRLKAQALRKKIFENDSRRRSPGYFACLISTPDSK